MSLPKVTLQSFVCLLLLYLLVSPSVAYADGTINVTTTQDEFGGNTQDSCSLREAIEAVNIHHDFGGCTLTGTAPFTIQLGAEAYTLSRPGAEEDANQTGDLDIHAPLLISGAGADVTTIQAGADPESAIDRVFHIMPMAEVIFADVTIANGVPEPDGNGGGILNLGAVTINASILTNNRALGDEPGQGGGALYNGPNSVATLNNTQVAMNQATTGLGNGGGILNGPNAILVVNGGAINDNAAARAGGGVENDAGTVTFNNLSLNNNTAGINGGGLHTSGNGSVQMIGGEANNNVANAEGGALWNSASGALVVEDAMIANNRASGADADQGGGGLFTDGGTLTVRNTTIMSNTANGAAGSGGGILAVPGSTVQVDGGLIQGNHANRAGGGIEVNGTADNMVHATLKNVELSGNTTGAAPGNGGALHITGVAKVTVSNATVTNNHADAEGGGLWNSAVGTLLVIDSTLTGNSAAGNDADQGGGALFNDGGEMTVIDTTLVNNHATGTAGSGGGILANAGSMLSVANSTLADNRASRAGGGIEVNATAASTATAKLDDVDFTNNATGAAPGNGGALHITGPATVTINGGTATGNRAAAEGGGFWNSAVGTLTVQNVTLENNTASGAAADQGGGALFTDGGAMSVFNTTMTGNKADGAAGSGGGILAVPGSTLTITGGALISNTASRAGGAIEVNGVVTNTVTATLNGVTMLNNLTGPAPGNGGALHITGAATVTVNGGMVMGNRAVAEGGGLWNSAIGTLTVVGTKIIDNLASGNDADQGGGGLFNDGGDLSVSNAIIRANRADGTAGSGGGILNNLGTLIVTASTIAGNHSNRAGGGVEDNAGESVRLQNVRLLKNSTGDAPGNGGALHITGAGTVDVVDSIVAENSAAAEGGGLWNSAVGILRVSGTTLNKNLTTNSGDGDGATAQGGGALFNDGGLLTVSNSTITGNGTNNGNGGGLLNAAGTSTVINVTLATNDGSGIANATGTVELANSIVAANETDCVGPISTNGAPNLDSDGSCGATITDDPRLGMLANNGGKTATLALLAGSPALAAGDDAICAAAPVNGVDQREVTRPQGANCDLGAYEADGAAFTNLLFVSSRSSGQAGDVAFRDEDILVYDFASATWQMIFDGSDVGVTKDVNAFTFDRDGNLLLSFNGPTDVPGLGAVDDSDVVRFIPTTLGHDTAGSFAWYLRGADVGLTTDSEDIDAISFTAEGHLVVSTIGNFDTPGARGHDEDLFRLDNATFGNPSRGDWRLYFDGSRVGLANEDINGVTIDSANGDLYLTVKDTFAFADMTIDADDIFVCMLAGSGADTSCTYRLFWGSAQYASGSKNLDGIHLGLLPARFVAGVRSGSLETITPEAAAEDDDADDVDIDDPPFDEAVSGELLNNLFLPLVER